MTEQQKEIDNWNDKCPVGTNVIVSINNSFIDARTASGARLHPNPDSKRISCVYVDGYGYIPIEDLTVVDDAYLTDVGRCSEKGEYNGS